MTNSALLSASVLLSIASCAGAEDTAPSVGISCEVATTIATKAYNRTKSAFEANNLPAAIMYSKSFWDVKNVAPDCSALDQIAGTLSTVHIVADTPVPPDKNNNTSIFSSASTFGVIPEACKDGGCKIIVTSPGSGVSSGAEAPKAYLLDSGKTTELKMINKAVLYKNDTMYPDK